MREGGRRRILVPPQYGWVSDQVCGGKGEWSGHGDELLWRGRRVGAVMVKDWGIRALWRGRRVGAVVVAGFTRDILILRMCWALFIGL